MIHNGNTDGFDSLRVDERFGFRTVQVRPGDGVYVNGVKILRKGADRAERR